MDEAVKQLRKLVIIVDKVNLSRLGARGLNSVNGHWSFVKQLQQISCLILGPAINL
jgi:hypothetical protein